MKGGVGVHQSLLSDASADASLNNDNNINDDKDNGDHLSLNNNHDHNHHANDGTVNSYESIVTTSTTAQQSDDEGEEKDENTPLFQGFHSYQREHDQESLSLLPSDSASTSTPPPTRRRNTNGQQQQDDDDEMPIATIIAILSTAFSYGCILTTLFLITLPIECERISKQQQQRMELGDGGGASIPKSVALGFFVAIAGITQLISPLIGKLSDTYIPPSEYEMELGQRMPYLIFGSVCTVIGLLGQIISSFYGFWIRYSFAFFLHMIGLNIMYSMMITLLPDQVPHKQVGVANGILALLLVTGSLFGFGLYHSLLGARVQNMYGLYTCIVIVSTILTGTHAHDRDVEVTYQRIESIRKSLTPKKAVQQHQDEDDSEEVREQRQREDSMTRSPQLPPGAPPWKKAARRAAKTARKVAHRTKQIVIKKTKQIVIAPTVILRTMYVDPFINGSFDWKVLYMSYTIDYVKYHDFFIVTVSRLFYYCGMSVQTFFLYYLQDIIGVTNDPEGVVANLAILGQCSGALTCYPVGYISDAFWNRRRKPFVYLACAILCTCTLSLIWIRSMNQMVIICLVLGAANGMYLTMDTSLAVDHLPKDIDDDGDGGSAQLLGVWGVAAFLGAALGPMIGGPLLYFVGKDGDNGDSDNDDDEHYTLAGYTVVLGLSAFYFLCSALSLCFIKDSHEMKTKR